MHRDQALDGLRAMAALCVLGSHVWLPGLGGGFIGVDVFFVLSGYLITRLLTDEFAQRAKIDIVGFWLRRAARLLPALFLVLVAVAVLGPYIFPKANIPAELAFTGLYASNFSRIAWNQPVLLRQTWSLAIEMQYYLIWPGLLVMLLRHAGRQTLAIAVGAYVGLSLWRWFVYWNFGWVWAYFAFDTHSTGLLLGGIVALAKWQPQKFTVEWMSIPALVTLAFAAIVFPFYVEPSSTWGGTGVEIAAAVLIVGITNEGSATRFLAWPPLARIGLWSYALYLWHYPIAKYAREHFDTPIALIFTLGLSLPLAALSFELYEKHMTKLLRSYFRRETKAASAKTAPSTTIL
ncbi:MAG TPA: acyltransferase [Devosia sp.]|nr:acyltransferase [Devosia sp.]